MLWIHRSRFLLALVLCLGLLWGCHSIHDGSKHSFYEFDDARDSLRYTLLLGSCEHDSIHGKLWVEDLRLNMNRNYVAELIGTCHERSFSAQTSSIVFCAHHMDVRCVSIAACCDSVLTASFEYRTPIHIRGVFTAGGIRAIKLLSSYDSIADSLFFVEKP